MLMRWLLSVEEFVLVSRLLIAFQYFCLMKKRHIIGVAHAGWRGVLGHIVQNVVQKMKDLGSDAKDIKTIIAPSIGPASFEAEKKLSRLLWKLAFLRKLYLNTIQNLI